jgi:hypothetical protein
VWQSPEDLLRAARDGSRWALWRIQEDVTASGDVPQEHADGAAEIVREFHVASAGIEQGHGTFSLGRFEQTWGERGAHDINSVLHAQLWTLLKHPLCRLLHSLLEAAPPDLLFQPRQDVRVNLGGGNNSFTLTDGTIRGHLVVDAAARSTFPSSGSTGSRLAEWTASTYCGLNPARSRYAVIIDRRRPASLSPDSTAPLPSSRAA